MKKITILMLAAAFCLVSCSDDEKDDKGGGNGKDPVGDIVIDPLITGNTEFSFATGDQIGLTVTKADGTAVAANAAVSYADNLFTTDIEWYTDEASSQVTAYYPYSSAGAPTTISIVTDQRDGYLGSEFLVATKSGVTPTANAVSMTFESLLNRVTINVDNQSAADISAVILRGLVPYADVDLAALEITARTSGPAADIAMYEAEANERYVALVIPQQVGFTIMVVTTEGKELTAAVSPSTLQKGGVFSVQVYVWDDKIEAIDYEDFGDSFRYEGDTYNTVTLANGSRWMADNLRYIPEGYTPSTDPTEESHIWYPYTLTLPEGHSGAQVSPNDVVVLTDDKSITEKGYLYDVYAAFGGVEITPENLYYYEGTRGICPPGWHIPTRAEYFDLFGSSSKDAFENEAPSDANALFYDAGYKGGKISHVNESGFNFIFSGARMQNGFSATPVYQPTILSGFNCSVEEWYNEPGLCYYLTSTAYKTLYDTATNPQVTNIQFFGLMSTFTSALYPEGRLSLGYTSFLTGHGLRCIQD